jgi:hypothetical protein
MLNRRTFLQCSAGLGLLGISPSFHPISPERVIVMTETGRSGREDRLEESLRRPFDLHSRTYRVPEGKLDLIFRLMRALTDHYGAPHLFPKWATKLAKREALGSATALACFISSRTAR